ncbi:AAA family ATPase [Mycobacterium decipiens]|uniref:AAA family ATPase n=1 Tax=Mycobacterium decipiens TaxID=1430326 RepID=UPI000E5CED07|nr:AAA family ATPase [Mycobacterium decipiens]
MRWVAAPNEAVVNRVEAAVESPDWSGVVLVGPDGVGKTLLAQLVSERVMARVGRARWVAGTAPGRAIPFGAFRHLIGLPSSGTDIGRPAALLRAARKHLTGDAGDLLLMIDDAHDLDTLSATLIYQLARARAARLVVTVRSGAKLPDAVAALWSDYLLTRVDIEQLDRAQTTALVESALDVTLNVANADEVFRRSLGNPLYLRHLVVGGGLEYVDGQWRCRGEDRLPLSGLVDEYLTALSEPARTVVDYLAIAGPLPRADLVALVGGGGLDALGQAEAAGAVRSAPNGETSDIFVGHPLYADRSRGMLTADRARALRTSVVTQLAKHPCDHVSDQLRLSVLATDTPAIPAPDTVADAVTAAAQALRLGDVQLAERLARAALDRSDTLAARLPLAYALAWQGRGREAGAVLAAVDPATLTETELMAWAIPRAANQFWMLDEPERATAFLQTTRNRVTEPTARSTLDALTATFAMNSANLPRAIRLASDVLSGPGAGDMAVAWAASAAALSSARMGRFGDVDRLAEQAAAAEHPGLLRFTVGLAQVTSLLMAGDVAQAHTLAQRFTDFAELQQPGRAIGEVLLAYVLIVKGEFGVAASMLEPAAATLERTGYSWGPLSLMLLATAIAQQGDIAESAKALRRAETRHGTKSALFAPELGLARAWTRAAARDTTGAIAAAREAARTAARAGQSAIALRAWHDAVRLGDIRAVDPVTHLATEMDCTVGNVVVKHARGLADGDAAALTAVAAELAGIGMAAAAADATEAAARFGRRER